MSLNGLARHLPLLLTLLATVLAAGWRLVDADEWPTPFHPTIQYESALAARALWCAADPDVRSPWFEQVRFAHVVSPPVLPSLVAGVYLVAGEECPWVAKLFATAFWLAAGWFIRAAAIHATGGRWAGTIAFTWFVLAPFGIKVSRSFQTESVLVFAFALAVWLLVRLRSPSWRATLVLGIACGLAALVKPGVLLFPLAAGFAGVVISAVTPYRWPKIVAFGALVLLPSLAYGLLMLTGHVGNKVMPELLLCEWFYEAVEKQIALVVSYPVLGLALAGVVFATANRWYLLPGLFTGYAAYVAVFTFHCATHDYYHAPLMVLAALALAIPLARLEHRWPLEDTRKFIVAMVILAAFLLLTRHPQLGPWRYTPEGRAESAQQAETQSLNRAKYRAVQARIGPGASVVVLGEAYGYPLEFAANVRRAFWPRPADVAILVRGGQLPVAFTAEGYLRELVNDRGFEYFAITDPTLLEADPELRAELGRAQLICSEPGLLVYDLRSRYPAGTRAGPR